MSDSKLRRNEDKEEESPIAQAVATEAVTPGIFSGSEWETQNEFDEASKHRKEAGLEPFSLKMDSTVSWFYRVPIMSTFFGIVFVFAIIAYNSEKIFGPRLRAHSGILSACGAFLVFGMLNFRDGPFTRPHPAFWRVVLGVNVIYLMGLIYLYFQDREHAQELIGSTIPLREKGYAENCEFTLQNIWNQIDIFCLAHALGWFGKAMILRDYWFCWILSILFEFCEYSLQLPNFAECWWDHWLLDVLLCNWGGLWLGMKVCEWLKVTPFSWRGIRTQHARTLRGRTARAMKQFTPYDWTEFKWEGTKRFRNYLSTVGLLSVFLLSELNVFYLKFLLNLEPEDPIVVARLAGIFLCALPAVRELYQYVSMYRKIARMGSHCVTLLFSVILELLIVIKWSNGMFPPFPRKVLYFWGSLVTLLVVYPIWKFGYRRSKEKNNNHHKSQ
ncbi:PSS-domain-containing protein [Atractiella rhizophila]|nr:PSS-domain-containing protein [Atractiella rhizophila]